MAPCIWIYMWLCTKKRTLASQVTIKLAFYRLDHWKSHEILMIRWKSHHPLNFTWDSLKISWDLIWSHGFSWISLESHSRMRIFLAVSPLTYHSRNKPLEGYMRSHTFSRKKKDFTRKNENFYWEFWEFSWVRRSAKYINIVKSYWNSPQKVVRGAKSTNFPSEWPRRRCLLLFGPYRKKLTILFLWLYIFWWFEIVVKNFLASADGRIADDRIADDWRQKSK